MEHSQCDPYGEVRDEGELFGEGGTQEEGGVAEGQVDQHHVHILLMEFLVHNDGHNVQDVERYDEKVYELHVGHI